MPPVGEDQAGAIGEENTYNQVHDKSDSTNDAVILFLENIFSDGRSNRPDNSWEQPLMVWAGSELGGLGCSFNDLKCTCSANNFRLKI